MNEPLAPVRVAALDDAKWDLQGIKDDLANLPDMKVIVATDDVSHFMKVLENELPDVAITDLRIHDDYNAGLGILSEIKTRFVATRCLVLTVYPALSRFVEALDRGADAFISKQAVHEGKYALPEVIRLMVRGGRVYEGELVLEMRQQLDVSRNPLSGPDVRTDVALSRRQAEILGLVSEGMTTPEIAQQLFLSQNTVKAHIRNILQLLDARDRQHAVRIARLNSLLLH
jgi:DNA-binding NarL/FixJ family response regulator